MNRSKLLFIYTVILLLIVGFVPNSRAVAQNPDQPLPPIDELTVIATYEIDLMAGPANTSAYLAPDGKHFAYFTGDEICIYTIQGDVQTCTDVEDHISRGRIDVESVRWSPDSRYLVFTNEFFRSFRDPDLWVFDASTGDMQNLTDDQFDGSPLMADDNEELGPIDIFPVWSADGSQILFMRYTYDRENPTPGSLFTIAPDGSDLQQVGTLADSENITVTTLDWSPDGAHIVYNIWRNDDDESKVGVWISDLDGSNPRQLAQMDTPNVPNTLTYSPDGQYVLTFSEGMLGEYQVTYDPEFSPTRVLAVDTGVEQLPGADAWVGGAAWSPTGHALAYVYANRLLDEENSGLYLSAGPGEPGRLVFQGLLTPPTSRWHVPLTWTANHTLLFSRSPERGIVVIQLGAAE